MDEDKVTSGMALAIVKSMSIDDRIKAKSRTTVLMTLIISMAVAFIISVCVYSSALRYQADQQREAARYQTDAFIDYIGSLVVETETIEIEVDSEGEGNANAIYGDDNTVAGGDING